MLSCGRVCRPTEIQREIELFPSSTRPARVVTDAGEGFVKGIGNPQGESALVSELVAAELGTWFGLDIPPFSVITNCKIDLQMIDHGGVIQPPMFFSMAVDGSPRDGGDIFLSRLRKKGDVARLVIFDTWIRNFDRYQIDSENSDNLLYVKAAFGRQYNLVPIDHSHCFIDADEVDFPTSPALNTTTHDPNVYGNFPEFAPYIHRSDVLLALRQLATINRGSVEEIVNSVPQQWGLGMQAASSLVNFVCERAEFVVNSISPKLVDDPDLPGT